MWPRRDCPLIDQFHGTHTKPQGASAEVHRGVLILT